MNDENEHLQGVVAMIFDVNRLFGKDPGAVLGALGNPTETSDRSGIHFATYVKAGARIEVQYEKRKATVFFVHLPVSVDSPERALALVNIDVRRRPQAEKSPIVAKWRGKFGNPGIKQVTVMKTFKVWNDICVQNEVE